MKNYFDLTGRVVLVTGGSSGLGVQFAKALANQGADIALCARRVDRMESVKAEIEALGVQCYIHKCDVTKWDEISATVKDTAEHYGKLDILVNNAGLAIFDNATDISNEKWLKMMDTNLNQVYFFSREAAKYMIPAHYGRIINIGSIHSTVSMTGFHLSAYGTTKGGVLMLTKSLANEWAKTGVTVNAIGPAYFSSEMTSAALSEKEAAEIIKTYCPMGRIGQQGELDTAVIYFASEFSSYTTGQLLQVDGGWTTI
jgi:NAD(P)-dependent dehydrogenase (short-subunit alcohol dehydrogenase family)